LELQGLRFSLTLRNFPDRVVSNDSEIDEEALQSSARRRQYAFSLDAKEFIHKPLDLDDYKSAVTGIVRKWAAPRSPRNSENGFSLVIVQEAGQRRIHYNKNS
jgi:hypothetical protein